MLIFGPLVWATTSPLTLTLASASASEVTAEPSTTSRAGSATLSPGPPETFSTSTTSPTATLYCLPPVLTMAYTEGSYLSVRVPRAWAQQKGASRTRRDPAYRTAPAAVERSTFMIHRRIGLLSGRTAG